MIGKALYLSSWEGVLPTPDEEPDLYFTSLHIAEEFGPSYAARARQLLHSLLNSKAFVILDLSPRGVQAMGYASLEQLARELHARNARCALRADYGFAREELLAAAPWCALAVNASTGTADLAAALRDAGASVWAIHNFYPRPETGLDETYLRRKTQEFQAMGIPVAAFISGDGVRRGPLEAGLPTLEAHRDLPPYVQYAQLTRLFGMDAILVGDPGVTPAQWRLMRQTERDGVLAVPAQLDAEHRSLYGRVFTIRPDSPEWLARLAESRQYATAGAPIPPANCGARPAGSITRDNARYLRYSGELQITRADLPACERVNVIGRVLPEYSGLLPLLRGGTRLRLLQPERLAEI